MIRIIIPFLFVFVVIYISPLYGQMTNVDQERRLPNIVILFTDDMGYGDLSSYGHPSIKTPNIDSLADQGIRFTSFLTGTWCVPSRTQLLTGRYMTRIDFGGGTGSDGVGGLPDHVITLAEGLKQAGYVTGMAGKWHLGYMEEGFLPPSQGFDSWFGMPYSNDYVKPWVQTEEPLALFRGTEIVEHPVDQTTLTTRYTFEATDFIQTHGGDSEPFFFYLAYNMPHLPINTTEEFRGQSNAGLYGDVIETIDWSVGEILDVLDEEGLSENTIVFFASDNGPWLNLPQRMLQDGNMPWHAGSPGLLRGSKATTYEGGARVPAMIRWPGNIQSGVTTDEIVASPDIYRTFLQIAGVEVLDQPLDGHNIMPFLMGEVEESPRTDYAYFLNGNLEAMRKGDWKLRVVGETTELFDLLTDPSERYNRAGEMPDIVEEIWQKMNHLANETGSGIGILNNEQ